MLSNVIGVLRTTPRRASVIVAGARDGIGVTCVQKQPARVRASRHSVAPSCATAMRKVCRVIWVGAVVVPLVCVFTLSAPAAGGDLAVQSSETAWRSLADAIARAQQERPPVTMSGVCHYAACLVGLAEQYQACGRWYDAEAVYAHVLTWCESDDVRAARDWQRCCARLSLLDYDGAAEEARRCISAAPFAWPLAYHWVARAQWRRGDTQGAVACWLEGLRMTRASTTVPYLDLMAPYIALFDDTGMAAYYDTLFALLERPAPDNVAALQRVLQELTKLAHVFPERFSVPDVAALAALPAFDAPAPGCFLTPRTNAAATMAWPVRPVNAVEQSLTMLLYQLRCAPHNPRALEGCHGTLASMAGLMAGMTNDADRIDGVLPRTLGAHLAAVAELQAWRYSAHSRSQQLARVVQERAWLQEHVRTQADAEYLARLRMDEAMLATALNDRRAAADAWATVRDLVPRSECGAVPFRLRPGAHGVFSHVFSNAVPLPEMLMAAVQLYPINNDPLAILAHTIARDDLTALFTSQTAVTSVPASAAARVIELCRHMPLTLNESFGEWHEPCRAWTTILDFLKREDTVASIVRDAVLCAAARAVASRLAAAVPASSSVEHTSLLRSLLAWRNDVVPSQYARPATLVVECDARHWPAGLTPVMASDALTAPVPMQPATLGGLWHAQLEFPAHSQVVHVSFLTNIAAAPPAVWQHSVCRDECVGDPLRVRLAAPRLAPVVIILECDARHVRHLRRVHVLGDHPALGAWVPGRARAMNDRGRAGDAVPGDHIWSTAFTAGPTWRELRFVCLAHHASPEHTIPARAPIRRYCVPDTAGPTSRYSFTYGFIGL